MILYIFRDLPLRVETNTQIQFKRFHDVSGHGWCSYNQRNDKVDPTSNEPIASIAAA